METKLQQLDGEWGLTLIPNKEVQEKNIAPKTLKELNALGTGAIPATVPGNFELDLHRAGDMPDPYFSTNPWKYQAYENRHLWYAKTFSSKETGDENTYLRFEGVDTVSEIFFNGEKLGDTDNMFLTYEFSLKDRLKKGENEILVHILPSTIVARKEELTPLNDGLPYNLASLQVRKPAYMFGWDIMPRFVSGGIWKSVFIVRKPAERLEQTYLYTTALVNENKRARVCFFVQVGTKEDDLSQLHVALDGVCGDSSFHLEKRLWHTYSLFSFRIDNPKLWFPRNAGDQNLYNVTVTLKRGDTVLDTKIFRFGIRTVELERTSYIDGDGKGEFVFKINQKKVFCMGSNWVPTDAFPSRWKDHRDGDLALLNDLGCNIVRCWGGNGYEDEAFFDECDEKGILVWQDFSMACGIYPQTEDFAKRLEKEAVAVVKCLRQHPSLALYAGDNECDYSFKYFNGARLNPNDNFLTRKILKDVVRNHTAVGVYLPSSPYVDEDAFATNAPISEDHLWGPRDYFKGDYYRTSVCAFASETGYHGCPSPDSLKKFIAKDKLFPIFKEDGNPNEDWLCHCASMDDDMTGPFAYRIRLMDDQVVTMFGSAPDNLSDYAKASQISQAEAFKYFIERFRLSKWRRTGIIWWNAVDGWPQISDAVTDWYGCKKLAYSYIKRSQNRLCLMFDEAVDGASTLYAVNDFQTDKNIRFEVKDITHGAILAKGTATVKADGSQPVWTGSLPENAFVLITWETEKGETGENHYSTKTKDISFSQYVNDLKKVGFDQWNGFDGE